MLEAPVYRDHLRPVEERVSDLIARMTLEEKVGQLVQHDGRRGDALKAVVEWGVGSVLCVLDDDTIPLQRAAMASRLGIPLLFGIDAIHGHSMKYGATIFPTQLGLACSWNEALAEEMARVTALEMSYTGVPWTFSPVFCLPRDLRWGRVGETFGEDPLLIERLGTAMVRGYQGGDLADPRRVAACAKHFAGYGDTLGGRDANESEHSRRKMRALFLPPFEAAVRAGAATVMVGYQSVDGVPCSANRWLLSDVLRGEWGFDGVVVTDWDNVGRLHIDQRICPTWEDASRTAIMAGNDLIMSRPDFYKAALNAVKGGSLPVEAIDEAVRHVLRLKFRLGLFENPRLPDPEGAKAVIGCDAHRKAALQAARESLVLLKNRDGALPLDASRIKRLAVIGPLADDPLAPHGDWTIGTGQGQGTMSRHPRACTATVLDGVRNRFGGTAAVDFACGCGLSEPLLERIPKAARAASEADAAILVLGDAIAFHGEYKSTATLELQGGQKELLDAVAATGTPLIVVLLASKPLAIPEVARKADAILCAFSPGMEGGTAIAEALAGDINPSGKLPIAFPWHVGQQPVGYRQYPGTHGEGYADLPAGAKFSPLFAFGQGGSYTTWTYRNLRMLADRIQAGEPVRAEVELLNTGERAGVEIVQAYVHDRFASVTWPGRTLVDFKRVSLAPGERATVSFEIPYRRLAVCDASGAWVVEPGDFELLVGGSSRDCDLLRAPFAVV